MNEKMTLIVGIILVVTGSVFLILPQFICIDFNIAKSWPIFLLIASLPFIIGYFLSGKYRNSGLYFTGIFLLLLGALMLYENPDGWGMRPEISPAPLFCLAVAFYLTFLADPNHYKGYLVTSYILGAIALTSFLVLAMVFSETDVLSAAFIISGALMLLYPLAAPKKAKKKPLKKKENASGSSTGTEI